jgi:hypothetical protein
MDIAALQMKEEKVILQCNRKPKYNILRAYHIAPCSLETARHFGTYSLHIQGQTEARQETRRSRQQAALISAGLFFGLLFDTEDRGDMFLKNITISLNYVSPICCKVNTFTPRKSAGGLPPIHQFLVLY